MPPSWPCRPKRRRLARPGGRCWAFLRRCVHARLFILSVSPPRAGLLPPYSPLLTASSGTRRGPASAAVIGRPLDAAPRFREVRRRTDARRPVDAHRATVRGATVRCDQHRAPDLVVAVPKFPGSTGDCRARTLGRSSWRKQRPKGRTEAVVGTARRPECRSEAALVGERSWSLRRWPFIAPGRRRRAGSSYHA